MTEKLIGNDKIQNTYPEYGALRIVSFLACLFSLVYFPKEDNNFFYSYYDYLMNRDIFWAKDGFWKQMNTFVIMSYGVAMAVLIINAFPVYIGFRFLGKRFTLFSCWMIVLTGLLTDILPSYVITQDTLLISIFGGMINGFAICLCLFFDATSGGTDFIAMYLSEKRGIDSFHIPLIINAVILTAAGFLFGWDKALYSIIFQYATTAVIRTLYRRYQRATLFIVTDNPDGVCKAIYDNLHHGATVLEGEGSYEHCERKVVYSVVSGSEAGKITKKIKEVDPHAFVNTIKTERLLGNFYRKPTD